MMLRSESQLEANLWSSVVQSDAKTQPVFRSNRNYQPQSLNVGEGVVSSVQRLATARRILLVASDATSVQQTSPMCY